MYHALHDFYMFLKSSLQKGNFLQHIYVLWYKTVNLL